MTIRKSEFWCQVLRKTTPFTCMWINDRAEGRVNFDMQINVQV